MGLSPVFTPSPPQQRMTSPIGVIFQNSNSPFCINPCSGCPSTLQLKIDLPGDQNTKG